MLITFSYFIQLILSLDIDDSINKKYRKAE